MNILNKKAYLDWLKGQPVNICAVLAVRSALRVFPLTKYPTVRSTRQDVDLWFRAARALLSTTVTAIGEEPKNVAATKFAFLSVAIDTEEGAHMPVFSSNVSATAAWVYAHGSNDIKVSEGYVMQAAADANSDAFSAIASQNLSLAVSIWNELNHDISRVEKGASIQEILSAQLWTTINPIEEQWKQTNSWIAINHGNSEFWIDWYQRHLDGRPQNWEMLEEIALIAPEDWDQGADHVNGLIAEIQAKYAVKEKIEAAQKVLAEYPVASAQIGHNNPPEEIEEPPFVAEDAAFVQKMLDDIAEESESSEPDVSRLRVASDGLGKVIHKVGGWLAEIVKVPITTFLGTLGSSAALKINDPLFAYLKRLLESLRPVIEAIETWLPSLGG